LVPISIAARRETLGGDPAQSPGPPGERPASTCLEELEESGEALSELGRGLLTGAGPAHQVLELAFELRTGEALPAFLEMALQLAGRVSIELPVEVLPEILEALVTIHAVFPLRRRIVPPRGA
jgi:hypothetical protein